MQNDSQLDQEVKVKDWKIFSLNRILVIVLFGLSFSFANLYNSQSSLMMMEALYDSLGMTFEVTPLFSVVYFIFGGLTYFLVFELFILVITRMFKNLIAVEQHFYGLNPSFDLAKFAHITRCFLTAGNVLMGLVHLLYFYYPLFINVGRIVVDFLILGAALLMLFVYYKRHLPQYLYGKVLMTISSVFLGAHGITIAMATIRMLV